MSFALYSIGFVIVIGGLIYAAHLMHVPAHWIAVGAVILLGVGRGSPKLEPRPKTGRFLVERS